ncbi:hypothetical protein [Lysobacter sp. FW306-1B-D06B]|uniref:rolling circle replication-associated protein n=1 Tax=Lysobacter sp. FW306-1B-D06B TaxID=3140250 RepID=UPI003140019A
MISLLTLTYRRDAAPTREDIHVFAAHLHRWAEEQGIEAKAHTAGMELSRHGVYFFHVYVQLPAGVRMPHADKAGWWPHGVTACMRSRHPLVSSPGQVGAQALGWSAGLRATAVTLPSDSLTLARDSALGTPEVSCNG